MGRTVITMDAAVPNLATGDVLVEGDRIAAVGVNIAAADAEIINASGSIVMLGLIDAHHHMWLGALRRLMPDVDDLFTYFDLVGEKIGSQYRALALHLSTKLTAVASLDAGITTVIDACHNSRSPEHTDAALDALDQAGIRALHMVGAALDKKASSAHPPNILERLALQWNADSGLVRVGLFGQLNLDWWKVARSLDMRILTEFIGDLATLEPEFAEKGVLGTDNIFNHCTRIPQQTWKMLADAGVNVTVNPRSDALLVSTTTASPTNRQSTTA
jgi:5-methylthioadenosine/S-adenosylhomocysteine deaminase